MSRSLRRPAILSSGRQTVSDDCWGTLVGAAVGFVSVFRVCLRFFPVCADNTAFGYLGLKLGAVPCCSEVVARGTPYGNGPYVRLTP